MNKALRKRLIHLRVDCELTQVRVATRAHISLSKYWRIEQGLVEPSEKELRALARVFRVPESDLKATLSATFAGEVVAR